MNDADRLTIFQSKTKVSDLYDRLITKVEITVNRKR